MEMTLKQVLADKPAQVYTAGPEQTIADCVAQMNRDNIGALLILTGDRLSGIFTERDLLTKVTPSGDDVTTTPVKQHMSTHVIVANPQTKVKEAMDIFTERRFRHLPIVEEGRLVGIVSSGDLIRWWSEALKNEISNLSRYIQGHYG